MSIGWSECLLIFFVVLLLFGAKRIPDIARSLGGATRAFKEGQEGLTKALDSVHEDSDKSSDKQDDKKDA